MYHYGQEMLSAFYVPDTFLGTGNTLVYTTDKTLKAWSYILLKGKIVPGR